MEYVVITRKIEIYVNEADKDLKNSYYNTVRKWQNLVMRGANYAASHLFVQENIKDFFYVVDGIKVKLADAGKDAYGIFHCSKQNTIYQLLSSYFKGEIPMSIMTCLSSQIAGVFGKESKEYYVGLKSLRSYRNTIPIPFQAKDIKHLQQNSDNRNYTFNLHNIPFATRLGRDRSNNEVVLERILSGEYQLCDSSIKVDKEANKLFLLATIKLPKQVIKLEEKKLYATLDFETPIVAKIGELKVNIGNKEEYLYQRLQIQSALRRLQVNLRYASGGRGRGKKLQAINRFEEKEKNYIKTKLHTYSAMLIDIALKNKCNTIMLHNYQGVKSESKENPEFLLRNWNYYGLTEMIKYKANKYNIKIELNEA